jgi:putative membrane protein insertion efficiency factor
LAVRGYQVAVSPLFAPKCRFYPSCSGYAVTAFRTHGLLKGAALAAWRLARCQPFNPGGVDHVPARGRWRTASGNGDDGPETSGARDEGWEPRRVTHGLA